MEQYNVPRLTGAKSIVCNGAYAIRQYVETYEILTRAFIVIEGMEHEYQA